MKTTKTADSFSNPMSCQCLNRNVTPQIQELRKAPRRSSRHCALCIFHEQHITSPSPSRQTSDMDFKSIHLAPNPCRYQVQVVIISRLDHCKRSLNPSSCFILLCQTQGSLRPRAGDGAIILCYRSPVKAQQSLESCTRTSDLLLSLLLPLPPRFRASHHSYIGLLSLPEFANSRTSACAHSSSSHTALLSHTHRSGQFCTDVLTSWAEPQRADVRSQRSDSGLLA